MMDAIISNLEERTADKNPAVIYLYKYHPMTFVIKRKIREYYGHSNVNLKTNREYSSYYTVKIKKQ